VKFKANGEVVWKKNFGGSGHDHFNSVTATTDGGIVAVGYSASGSFGNGDWTGVTGKGGNDAIIVKFFSGNVSGDDPGDGGNGNGGSGDNTLMYIMIVIAILCVVGVAVYFLVLKKR
jgi:hypothetical protein